MKGFVKRISDKGYSFIKGHDGKEYFMHMSCFNGFWHDLMHDVNELHLDVEVEFDVVSSAKGPRAENVVRLDFPNQASK